MNNDSHDFETWFATLQMHVNERTGVIFCDRDAAEGDYERGMDVFDVIDDICNEYGT